MPCGAQQRYHAEDHGQHSGAREGRWPEGDDLLVDGRRKDGDARRNTKDGRDAEVVEVGQERQEAASRDTRCSHRQRDPAERFDRSRTGHPGSVLQRARDAAQDTQRQEVDQGHMPQPEDEGDTSQVVQIERTVHSGKERQRTREGARRRQELDPRDGVEVAGQHEGQ